VAGDETFRPDSRTHVWWSRDAQRGNAAGSADPRNPDRGITKLIVLANVNPKAELVQVQRHLGGVSDGRSFVSDDVIRA
jgi:hypothetical protein